MQLHFCPICSQAIPEPVVMAEVIRAIDADSDVCEHAPPCLGPWTHAVRVVREAWQRGQQQSAARRV